MNIAPQADNDVGGGICCPAKFVAQLLKEVDDIAPHVNLPM